MINQNDQTKSKEKILQIARDLCNQVGFYNVSIKDVAEKLSLTSASIYKHFEGLEEIKLNLTTVAFREILTILQDCNSSPTNSEEKIVSFAFLFRKFSIKNPGLLEASQYRKSEEPLELQQFRKETQKAFLGLFASFSIPKENLLSVSRVFRGLLFGLLSLEIQKSYGLPEKPEASFKEGIQIYLAGIKMNYGKEVNENERKSN